MTLFVVFALTVSMYLVNQQKEKSASPSDVMDLNLTRNLNS